MARKKIPPAELLAFQIKVSGLPVPVTEFIFARPRLWRFDFAWPDIMVAVEAEGGTWTKAGKSRHTTGSGHAEDCYKYNAAALRGWKVLRFPSDQIISGAAINMIMEVFSAV